MSFLAPLFLLGGLAIALPVVFHLIRRTTRERTLFSSLMFVRLAPPRLTQRSRIEHWLLLLLRCAALALLAFGFARPFIKQIVPQDASGGAARRMVLLLDTSASMQRGDWWPAARSKAESLLRPISAADEVALVAFDRTIRPLVSFEQWKATPPGDRLAMARQQLAGVTPGWAGTHLDQALIRAGEMLTETDAAVTAGARQVVLISDLQAGSRLGTLQMHEWPKGVEVVVEQLKPGPASNAGLQWAPDMTGASPAVGEAARVRVSNEPDAKREQFQVGWADAAGAFVGTPKDIYVPAGQSRMVILAAPPTNASVDRIVLRGDDERFDDTIFVVPPETDQLSVLYIGTEQKSDPRQPLYFLDRAFQETHRQAVRVLARQPGDPLDPGEMDAARLYVVTAPLDESHARSLRAQVAQGKTLLFVPTGAPAAASLMTLLQLDRVRVEEGSPTRYAMLGEIDFRHPLFGPFADARFSDFTKVHFWKYRRIDPEAIPHARVLARFDNGDAALLEVPVGSGRVLILASGWHPADSQLALSTKFVPLLYSVLELGGGAAPPPPQYVVGDTVPLAAMLSGTNSALTVVQPAGPPLKLAAHETNFTQTLQPGIYRLSGGSATNRFVVNLDAAESRTAPLPFDELERLGAPVASEAPAAAFEAKRKAQWHHAELESRQKLWRWFLVATLAVLLIETWLAGWTARRATTEGVTT